MSILITIQAYGNSTMDCTIVAFYSEAKTQIKILRYNFEKLLSLDNDEGATYADLSDKAKELRNRFVNCAEHYKKIAW